MKKILVLLFFYAAQLSAQDHFGRVRAGIEDDETGGLQAYIDSISRLGLSKDSCIYYRGLLLLREDKVKEARNRIKDLRAHYPDFYMTAYLDGLVLFRMEDYARSAEAFTKVIARDSQCYKAFYNRALVSGLLEDYKAAREDLSSCIAIAPRSAQAYYSRAYWEELAGQFTEALSDYEQSISISGKYYDAYLGIAHIYHLQKNDVKACETISRAVEAGSQIAVDIRENYCR